ncbi:hypothetical protein J2S78_003131 [Salibacterium salarium]|nr:hypothetical protein [Salibacterium salarium]
MSIYSDDELIRFGSLVKDWTVNLNFASKLAHSDSNHSNSASKLSNGNSKCWMWIINPC